jgi:hypothetical protein
MRRHELDPVSLTFGFAFTGLGLLFLLGRADQALRLRWVWPILLLVLGVGILADLARHRDRAEEGPAEEDPARGDPAREDPAHAPALDPEPALTPAPGRDFAPDSDPAPRPALDPAPEGVVDNREHLI